MLCRLPCCALCVQGNEAFRDSDYPAAYDLYTKVGWVGVGVGVGVVGGWG